MYILPIVVIIVLVGIDQLTKYLALNMLAHIGSVTIIEKIFSLTFVENRGAAFGIMQGGRLIFLVAIPIILIATTYYYIKLPQGQVYKFMRMALVLIMAGAIGNYLDRLFRGYVIDFFHATFIDFPVFNVADIFVVCGTISLSVLLIFFVKDDIEL